MAANFDKPLPKNYSSCRELRNLAEKQRRDKLNHYVNELSTLVPFVADHKSQKRVDKISVLRLAASYIRLHKILDKETQSFSGKRLSSIKMDASQTLLQAIGGFLLVVSSSGKVIYVSEAVEDAFGYTQSEILGQSFFQFIHEDDKILFKRQLLSQETTRRSFYCRMLEKSSRNEPIRYEIIHVVGTLKKIVQPPQNTCSEFQSYPRLRTRKRLKSTNSAEGEDDESTNDDQDVLPVAADTHMIVSFVKIVRDRPITEVSWVESMRDEYITRHRIDGTIAHVDHRISFVTGMIPSEVIGQMAYSYIHQEDVLWSLLSNRQMLYSSEGQGEITVRVACKDGKYVALRCRGFLEINKSSGEIDSFVCINTVMSRNDAKKEIMRERQELANSIRDQSPQDLINEIIAQLPPNLFVLLKNILRPSVIQKMIQNVSNLDLDDGVSMVVQPTDLARKLLSNAGTSKLTCEQLQFPVKAIDEQSLSSSQPQGDWFMPPAKRQRTYCSNSTPDEVIRVDALYNSEETIIQNANNSFNLDPFDSQLNDVNCFSETYLSPCQQSFAESPNDTSLNLMESFQIPNSSNSISDLMAIDNSNHTVSVNTDMLKNGNSLQDINLLSFMPSINGSSDLCNNSNNRYLKDTNYYNKC